MAILMSSAFAVTRSINGKVVTYSTSTTFGSLSKAYWAVEDTIGNGCTLTSVAAPTTGFNCGTDCQYSIQSGVIRLVVYPPSDAAYDLPDSVQITLAGTGSGCTLTGNYVESRSSSIGQKTGMVQGTISLTTCISMNDVLLGINEWKSNLRTMNSLLNLISQWKSNSC